jgi:hypothetical protein
MNTAVDRDDLKAIEHEVYPDIIRRLVTGFKKHVDKKARKRLAFGTYEDDTLPTIRGEELEIVLRGADGVPLEDICNIAAQHPLYLCSYLDEGAIRMQFLWVKPEQSSQKLSRRTIVEPRSSFWTVRRLLILILMAMFIALFKGKLLTLAGLPPSK